MLDSEINIRDITSLAIVCGASGYHAHLFDKIKSLGLEVEIYGWAYYDAPHRNFISPFNKPQKSARHLKTDGITHVIHTGKNCRPVLQMAAFHLGIDLDKLEVDQVNHDHMSSLLLRTFSQDYHKALMAAKVTPLNAAQLFPEFKPHVGIMGRSKVSAEYEAKIPALVQRAMDRLGNPHGYVAQCVAFDDVNEAPVEDITIIDIEQAHTDAFLKHLINRHKPSGATRTVVKVCPTLISPALDPPTLGQNTITLARKAQVDVIILDATHGVMSNRDRAILTADELELALIGYLI